MFRKSAIALGLALTLALSMLPVSLADAQETTPEPSATAEPVTEPVTEPALDPTLEPTPKPSPTPTPVPTPSPTPMVDPKLDFLTEDEDITLEALALALRNMVIYQDRETLNELALAKYITWLDDRAAFAVADGNADPTALHAAGLRLVMSEGDYYYERSNVALYDAFMVDPSRCSKVAGAYLTGMSALETDYPKTLEDAALVVSWSQLSDYLARLQITAQAVISSPLYEPLAEEVEFYERIFFLSVVLDNTPGINDGVLVPELKACYEQLSATPAEGQAETTDTANPRDAEIAAAILALDEQGAGKIDALQLEALHQQYGLELDY